MTLKSIYDLLKTIGIPVAYNHFDEKMNVTPPFIVYRESAPDTFKADNITYYKDINIEIELVTIKKDVTLQNQIEELFTSNNIPYDSTDEIWDEEEKIYHNFYEI